MATSFGELLWGNYFFLAGKDFVFEESSWEGMVIVGSYHFAESFLGNLCNREIHIHLIRPPFVFGITIFGIVFLLVNYFWRIALG